MREEDEGREYVGGGKAGGSLSMQDCQLKKGGGRKGGREEKVRGKAGMRGGNKGERQGKGCEGRNGCKTEGKRKMEEKGK